LGVRSALPATCEYTAEREKLYGGSLFGPIMNKPISCELSVVTPAYRFNAGQKIIRPTARAEGKRVKLHGRPGKI
jgi:hypothetical protein